MMEINSASRKDGGQSAPQKGAPTDGRGTEPEAWQKLQSSFPQAAQHSVTHGVTGGPSVTRNVTDAQDFAASERCLIKTDSDGYPEGIARELAVAFEKFALQAAGAGRPRFSARSIIERIRWHTQVEEAGAFKCNNNNSRPLALWFLARHPELENFFELRGEIDEDEDQTN